MATSQKNIRSISLPSRLNPTSDFESELQKLKSFNASNSLPISSESIQTGLVGLAELYNSVEELIITQSPTCILQQHQDGSVDLIDSCNNIRELFQMMKENVQSLQSALRRKGLECSSSIQDDIKSYSSFRKKINKCVSKSLKTLKNIENKNKVSNINSALKEATEVTVSVFKDILDILAFLSCPTMVKSGGWNLISKLMLTKSGAYHGEVGSVDFAVSTILQGRTKSSGAKVIDVQRSLKDLDVCIEGVEERLEILYKQMIRSRVAILNVLTDH